MKYYVIWEESGVKKKKTYSSKPGVAYWKKKIVSLLGEKAIIEEGQELPAENEDEEPKKVVMTEKEKPLGPVDEEKTKLSPDKTGKFVLSNWNSQTGTYTSRIYGTLTDKKRVIEPDGSISLEGDDIIKKHDKEKGIYTLTDGRKFSVMGWPV
jgi:hypothetical protein